MSHPCCCQYTAADRMASRETFHVDGDRSAHCGRTRRRTAPAPTRPGTTRAELGHDPAQDPAVGPAGAGMLGSAQGGEVGVGGLAEGESPAAAEAVDGRCHVTDPIRANDIFSLVTRIVSCVIFGGK